MSNIETDFLFSTPQSFTYSIIIPIILQFNLLPFSVLSLLVTTHRFACRCHQLHTDLASGLRGCDSLLLQ